MIEKAINAQLPGANKIKTKTAVKQNLEQELDQGATQIHKVIEHQKQNDQAQIELNSQGKIPAVVSIQSEKKRPREEDVNEAKKEKKHKKDKKHKKFKSDKNSN